MLEELKAQSIALFFVELLRERGILTDLQAQEVYVDSITWAFGHVSRGMYTPSGQRKAYSQLAAIQLGVLMDEGAVVWDPSAPAANGSDVGAFKLNFEKFPTACEKLMRDVARVKAKNDKKGAEGLAKKYVEGDKIPQGKIAERVLRFPKNSFVYSVDL